MKKASHSVNSLRHCGIIIAVTFLFTACNFYNFSEPQPYDKENIYQFPDDFLGKWKEKDTAITYGIDLTIPVKEKAGDQFKASDNPLIFETKNSDSDFYCIYKNHLVWVTATTKKLVAGAWPRLNKKMEFVYQPKGFAGQDEIIYDSMKQAVDTIRNYIISGNRIYEKTADRYLGKGYHFTRQQDTISIHETDSVYIDLGQNAFLRKLTDSLYVFNINNSVLSLNEIENWWSLVVLEIAGKGRFNKWECNTKSGDLPCMFYDRPSKSDQFYFDCRWSTADMLRLIKEGYFERSGFLERTQDLQQ